MNNNEEVFVTGLTTDQDNINTIVEETTSAIENKTQQLQFNNRAERRAFAKKLGKSGRADIGTISETAKKLTYINLIEEYKNNQNTDGYTLTKYNTTYKSKKDRKTGEIIDEYWLVSVTKEYEVM